MTIRPGEFWVAEIPFTSGKGSKKRPVLVLWIDGSDVVVAAVTSAKPRSQFDVPLNDWSASGLRVPSTVRLSRLDSLERPLLIAKVGALSSGDSKQMKEAWSNHVKPQF
jgi:mRNA interferase MazF